MNQLISLALEVLWPNRERHAIPPLDGALRPNALLDAAEIVVSGVNGPRGLCEGPDGELYFGSGNDVWAFAPGGTARAVRGFNGRVTALHWDAGTDAFLVGVAGEGVVTMGGSHDGGRWNSAAGLPISDPTDIAVIDGKSYVTEGSTQVAPGDWRRDLLQKGRSGRLLRLRDDGAADVVLSSLAYPAGICTTGESGIGLFAESWSHAVRPVANSGGAQALGFENAPGYPGHLSPSRSGGFWVAFFALRTHLVEFVLQEDGYRRDMMQTVPEDFWVAPTLTAGEDMLAPLQFGRIKTMGATKPWAPPRSYGLVVEYDAQGMPARSFHSRTGATMHGITSVCETAAGVFATCHSAAAVIKLPEA